MSGSFADFHQRALFDPELLAELRGADASEPAHFVDDVVRIGATHGYQFESEEVTQAVMTYRRAWFERWLD